MDNFKYKGIYIVLVGARWYNRIMYFRVSSRKNKNNKVVKYVQLAHNARNPKSGSPQAEVIHSFGRMDELDMDTLKRLARRFSVFWAMNPYFLME